jgi:hypothetical protein
MGDLGGEGLGLGEGAGRGVAGVLGFLKELSKWVGLLRVCSHCRSCSPKFEFRVLSPRIRSVSLKDVNLVGSYKYKSRYDCIQSRKNLKSHLNLQGNM